MQNPQKPLELILARNLLTSISTPSFLVDGAGTMVFYNEAAAALLGRSFEEAGQMSAEEWTATFGPLSSDGDATRARRDSPDAGDPRRAPAHGNFCIRTARQSRGADRGGRVPDRRRRPRAASGAMIMFWPRNGNGSLMKIKVWGARGSVPAPGPEMNRYGGNTSCVQVTFRDGSQLILDAGTGIRTLGLELADAPKVGILLTHLHLDHIQGLMFFPPCFRSDAEITIWGPSSPEASLEDRIARYISAPALAGRGARAPLLGRVPATRRRPSGRSATS